MYNVHVRSFVVKNPQCLKLYFFPFYLYCACSTKLLGKLEIVVDFCKFHCVVHGSYTVLYHCCSLYLFLQEIPYNLLMKKRAVQKMMELLIRSTDFVCIYCQQEIFSYFLMGLFKDNLDKK